MSDLNPEVLTIHTLFAGVVAALTAAYCTAAVIALVTRKPLP